MAATSTNGMAMLFWSTASSNTGLLSMLLDALDVDAAHPEAGLADRLARGRAGLRRHVERDQGQSHGAGREQAEHPARQGSWRCPA